MKCDHDWRTADDRKKFCDEPGCSFIQILELGKWHSMDEMPKCPGCKQYVTWLGMMPGVECKPCGLRWSYIFNAEPGKPNLIQLPPVQE